MIKILSSQQIKNIDIYTIANEPIKSIDLMERAATNLFYKLVSEHGYKKFLLLAGPGNNGGDAVALFRMLVESGLQASLIILNETDNFSEDCLLNIQRLKEKNIEFLCCKTFFDFPKIDKESIIIDGIFGSGLNKPIKGFYADIIEHINKLPNHKVAIDIPSGLFSDNNRDNHGAIIMANETYTLQIPKLAFFFAENSKYVGDLSIIDIGLHPKAIELAETKYFLTEPDDIDNLYIPRPKHTHKGNFGHTLVVAGNEGKYGAMILCASACLRSGAGLVSVFTNRNGELVLNSSIPEAMTISNLSDLTRDGMERFTSIGIGPGIGVSNESETMLLNIIKNYNKPIVLDADALNLVAKNRNILEFIPKESIFTPHVGEFDRLFGKCNDTLERIEKASDFCKKQNMLLVLKGKNSAVVDQQGNVHFNATGNQGMSTAGSGDVLTGIISGLLSVGYKPKNATLLGVWLHGKAGDKALDKESYESLIATDIIKSLGTAFKTITPNKSE
ncbi:MAG TPA: NAD(P)H-hydrate dehydratase [Salinivirgaceae bacterium]|nr:NAD(P)H-hydrate dehydratase [Salinivirgaceae bacterium]HQA75690.1 NAD(P)H-hydrate dehydratase [Salinivirgaceae bacterium]